MPPRPDTRTPPSPFTWPSGPQSKAGNHLHAWFCTTPVHHPPSTPFLELRTNRAALLKTPQTMHLAVDAFIILVFDDNSSLIIEAPETATLRALPRIVRFDPHWRYKGQIVSFGRLSPATQRQFVRALWDDHAKGPVLARPTSDPLALRPDKGTFWSPFDTFNPTILANIDSRVPQSIRDTLPAGAAVLPINAEDTAALLGMAKTLYPTRQAAHTTRVYIHRGHWDTTSPFVVSVAQGTRSFSWILAPRARRLFIQAFPTLAQQLGNGFWGDSKQRPPGGGHAPSIQVHTDAPHSAHALLQQTQAWASRLTPSMAQDWAHLVHHA